MWNSKIRSKLVGCLAYIHPIKNGFCSIPSLHIKRQKPWVQNRYIWYIIILSLYISLQDKPCRDFSVDFKGSRKSVVRWKIVPLVPCHFSSIYLSMVVTPPKKKTTTTKSTKLRCFSPENAAFGYKRKTCSTASPFCLEKKISEASTVHPDGPRWPGESKRVQPLPAIGQQI